MAEQKKLTCISCPIGCQLTVDLADDGTILKIEGNSCPRGPIYAQNEVTNPKRVVTSTVRVNNSSAHPVVSVRTVDAVPKDKIFEVMDLIRDLRVALPIQMGDVLITNIADTGTDLIATRSYA